MGVAPACTASVVGSQANRTATPGRTATYTTAPPDSSAWPPLTFPSPQGLTGHGKTVLPRATGPSGGALAVPGVGLSPPTCALIGLPVIAALGRPSQPYVMATKTKTIQVAPITLKPVLEPVIRVGAGGPRAGAVRAAPAPRGPIRPGPTGLGLTGMRRKVGPLDVPAETVLGIGKTALGPPVPSADVPAGEEEVAVPTRDAPYGSATVVVLALLEGRPAHTRHTPHTPASDIGALGPSRDVPFLVAAPRTIRLKTPSPEEAWVIELSGDGTVRTAAAEPDAGGAGSAMV